MQALWPEGIVSIAAGEYFSAAVSLSGRVFTWGRNKYGQLGNGGFGNAFIPQPVPGITDAVQVQNCLVPDLDVWRLFEQAHSSSLPTRSDICSCRLAASLAYHTTTSRELQLQGLLLVWLLERRVPILFCLHAC